MDGKDALNYILENKIEGCLVECGVYQADFQIIWITELMKNNLTRDIYLFDTFSGMTEPSDLDYTCKGAIHYHMDKNALKKWWENEKINKDTNGICYYPLRKVQYRLKSTGYDEDYLHYIVGDVMDTLQDKKNIPEKIAILRLDTDWYESSKYELEQLYDNVVEGGVIIFDDYYHWEGQRKATDEFFKSRNLNFEFKSIGNGKTSSIIKKLS
jgi:hypothetical protein